MVREEEYLLTSQEILGGIKSALARGDTLKQAMMSFYQSGYKKEEIEDAARAYLYLQRGIPEENLLKENEKKTPIVKTNFESKKDGKLIETPKEEKEAENKSKKEEEEKLEAPKEEKTSYGYNKTKIPFISAQNPKEDKKILQKISGYESPKVPSNLKGKTLTAVLIITLIVLLGILGLVFLFKDELIIFINGLFG